MKELFPSLLFTVASLFAAGQDTLPNFTVRNVGNNRVVIDWVNSFESVRQISIQRSFDSLKNYKTILTVPDPSLEQNGYADSKGFGNAAFYRLYILLDQGNFLFSSPRRAVWDTIVKREMLSTSNPNLSIPVIPGSSVNGVNVSNKNGANAGLWVPSKFVYTFKDGYIRINLPDDEKKYSIKFFTEDNKPLFELKEVKEKSFRIDKSNFYRSGWFRFELYGDGELVEKNKFFLPREF